MKQPPQWFTFIVVLALPLAAIVDCSSSGNTVPPPPPPPPPTNQGVNQTPKPAASVLRAKLQPCNTFSDCLGAQRVPRCALNQETYFSCDKTDAGGQPIPAGYSGFCYYSVPIPNSPAFVPTLCTCYEGDIRYCDLNGWQTCTPANFGTSGSCGIQMCEFGPLGQADASTSTLGGPVPQWGPCLPLVPVIPDGGSDAGVEAGNDGGTK